MKRIITRKMLGDYALYLQTEEKSRATIDKYLRDVQKLKDYADGKEITKELMIAYKERLLGEEQFKVSSINSYLVAANRFLEYQGWYDARVKTYKVQREVFCPENRYLSRAEYIRLVKTAKSEGRLRLSLILQTICATGMRISELNFVTVAAVKRGLIEIHCKGKIRKVLLPEKLQKEILYYIKKKKVENGIVFCTSTGKALNRTNIWREMKSICKKAGVEEDKVFPHNLRHLFAQCFYEMKKDIAKLADILGHSSIETTRIYIRTTGKEYKKQLERMELVVPSGETT